MRITGIRITNFGRFRGDHELDLAAGVYAIVARAAGDADRSNWLGKSTFLHAIDWALYGALVARKWPTLDAAISTDAPDMAVDVELSDGTFVSRAKRRGQPAQLKLVVPDGRGGELRLAQNDAQRRIVEVLGMSEDDFANTVWVGQKSMSRLVTTDPATRTDIVVDWLQLGPLEVAARYVAEQAGASEVAMRAAASIYNGTAVLADRILLEADIAVARDRLRDVRQTIASNQAAREMRERWALRSQQHAAVAAALADLRAREQNEPPCASDRLLALSEARAARARWAYQDVDVEDDRLRKLDGGQGFDGRCPVMCAPCPVADKVRASGESIRKAREVIHPRLSAAVRRMNQTRDWRDRVVKMRVDWGVWNSRLRQAAERYAALRDQSGLLGEPDEIGPEPPVPDDPDLEAAVRAVAAAEAALADHDAAVERRRAAERDMTAAKRRFEIQQAALRILSRGGAQRRIATRALGDIERIANATLTRCGIALTVSLQYGRELQKIADVCDCGAAYPRSAAVKVCPRCGAVRGKKRDEKLYVVVSESSGAAEDLAGVAVQLAAARWRRAARGAAWGVVALDEPFGACDRHNRRALAQSLAALAADGIEQTFVVAHSDDVLEAMPRRLVITADGPWSRIEVG